MKQLKQRRKKNKIPNEFSICNYLNVNTNKDKDFIECGIRYLLENGKLKHKPKNGVNSYFKIYSTECENSAGNKIKVSTIEELLFIVTF